jgi:DNA modification methylase
VRYLATEAVPLASLDFFPGNPRRGDVAAIRASVRRFGQYRSVLVREAGEGRPRRVIVAGNHTVKAMAEEGHTEVRVEVGEFADDGEARRINAADNRLAELGGYDKEALADLLELFEGDFEGTGWVPADLLELRPLPPPPEDPEDAPVPAYGQAPRLCSAGQVWALGPHRLLIGDCRDAGAVAGMLDGDLCDCMWTDPPYGVDYEGAAGRIAGDTPEGLPELLEAAFAAATTALIPGAAVYVAHPAAVLGAVFAAAFQAAGWRLRQELVWVKDSMTIGHGDYQYRHEAMSFGDTPRRGSYHGSHAPVEFGYTAGGGRRGRGAGRRGGWYGGHNQTTVFEVPKPRWSKVHPTMKPVELVSRHLVNSCPPGGLVYDPFAGSGSTLLAAHRLGMRARVAELDPKFGDVICYRFAAYAGLEPVLIDAAAA